MPTGKLADFHPAAGDGIKPAWGKALVAIEEAVDRIGGIAQKQDDGAGEFGFLFVKIPHKIGVGGDEVPLLLGKQGEQHRGIAERFGWRSVRQFFRQVAGVFVAFERRADGCRI